MTRSRFDEHPLDFGHIPLGCVAVLPKTRRNYVERCETRPVGLVDFWVARKQQRHNRGIVTHHEARTAIFV